MNRKQLEKGIADLALETLKLADTLRSKLRELREDIVVLKEENRMLRDYFNVEIVTETVEGEYPETFIRKIK